MARSTPGHLLKTQAINPLLGIALRVFLDSRNIILIINLILAVPEHDSVGMRNNEYYSKEASFMGALHVLDFNLLQTIVLLAINIYKQQE
jgi:hypothetical protein